MDFMDIAKAIGIGIVGGVIGFSISPLIMEPVIKTNPVNSELVKQNAVLSEQAKELVLKNKELQSAIDNFKPEVITKIVNQTVVKEVKVDNGNLDLVLDYLISGENVSLVTEDLSDSEVSKIVDRIHFINDSKGLGLNFLKKKFENKVDGMVVNGTEIDKHYIERIKYDKEQNISHIDFDYKDADVFVSGTFEQFEVVYKFNATIQIKNDEAYRIKEINIKEV
jgi:hypothetical protein